MKKAYLFERRKKAKKLKQKGWTITKIACYLVAGRRHVNKWINMSDEKLERDNRGWKKGKPRKYRKGEKEGEDEYAFINILKQEIQLPKNLINLFVFCILDIELKKLYVHTEGDDGKLNDIKTINFVIKNIIY